MYHYTRVQILTRTHFSSQSEGRFVDSLNEAPDGFATLATGQVYPEDSDESNRLRGHER